MFVEVATANASPRIIVSSRVEPGVATYTGVGEAGRGMTDMDSIRSTPRTCSRGQSLKTRRRAAAGTVVALLLCPMFYGCGSSEATHQSDTGSESHEGSTPGSPGDEAAAFLAKYPGPDLDDNTAYDNPRPPLVTRWLVYRRVNLEVLFLAGGQVGDPPPYSAWRLIAVEDSRTKSQLSAEAIRDRLARLTGSTPDK